MPPLLRRLVYFQQSICVAEKRARFLHPFPYQNQVKSLFSMELWSWVIICTSVLFVVFLWIWATDHLFWHFFYDLEAQFLTLPSASFASSDLRKSLQVMIYINNLKTKYDNGAIANMTENIRKSVIWNTPNEHNSTILTKRAILYYSNSFRQRSIH